MATSGNRATPTIIAIVALSLLVAAAPFLARYRGAPVALLTKIQQMSVSKQANPEADLRHSVWVNRRSGLFYCRGSRFYGRIHPGTYMRQGTALQKGFRPAEGRVCP